MAVKIQNGGSEPIYTAALMDASRTLLTGLSNVYVRVRRESDGYYLDFGDMTFKASPGSIQTAMSEVSAANMPGVYLYDFDLSNVTNETQNDVYLFVVNCASAINAPQQGELITDDLEARSGWGTYTFTATVQDSADSSPIPAATVQIRNAAGTIVVGQNTTNVNGQCTFLLDTGTYSVYVYATGYTFSNPYVLGISGNGSATYQGTAFSVGAPGSADVCRVYGFVKDIEGAAIQGVRVRAELNSRSAYITAASSGTLITNTTAHAVTNADGYWYIDLIPNADLEVEPTGTIGQPSGSTDTSYTFHFDGANYKRKYSPVIVPDETTADFKTLV